MNALVAYVDRNIAQAGKYSSMVEIGYKGRYAAAFLYLALGAFCVGFALVRSHIYGLEPGDIFCGGFGVICLVYGLNLYRRVRAMSKFHPGAGS